MAEIKIDINCECEKNNWRKNTLIAWIESDSRSESDFYQFTTNEG